MDHGPACGKSPKVQLCPAITGIVRELDSPHNFSERILKSPHVPMYSFPNLKPPQLTPLVLDQGPNRDFYHVGSTSKARRSQF